MPVSGVLLYQFYVYSVPVSGVLLYQFYRLFCASFRGFSTIRVLWFILCQFQGYEFYGLLCAFFFFFSSFLPVLGVSIYEFYDLFCASFRGFTLGVLWFILCQFQGFYYTSYMVYSMPVLGVLLYELYGLFYSSF